MDNGLAGDNIASKYRKDDKRGAMPRQSAGSIRRVKPEGCRIPILAAFV